MPLSCPIRKIVPLIQNHLRIRIAMLVEKRLDDIVLCNELVRSRSIKMVREEIQLNFVVRHIFEEVVSPIIILTKCRSADLEVRETFVQVICSDFVKLEEICIRTVPCRRHVLLPTAILESEVRFIPYFPIFYVIIETVSPAFCIVTDNVLTYFRPLLEILWRDHTILLAPLLNGLSQTIEHLCACGLNVGQKCVRQLKVI